MDKQIEELAEELLFYTIIPNDELCDEVAEYIINAGYRKQEDVAFEVIDKFRDELINIFIDMCFGNDYNKINLLQIGDAIDAVYDSYIAELKNKYGVK